MIRILILLLAVCVTAGCDTYDHVPAPRRQPRTPLRSQSIVVLTSKSCAWCEKQKKTLDSMKPELRGVSVKYLSYEKENVREDYPGIRSFPTVYINGMGYTGYQTREEILSAL